jgi:hypothetical protein
MGLSPGEAVVASAACLTLLPAEILALEDFPGAVRLDLLRELTTSSLHSADGQLSDVTAGRLSWAHVMRCYAGKTGAPYARDTAMAARLAGVPGDRLDAWRSFGRLFGVLRQLANDRATPAADQRNGTATLLLAHAAEVTDSGGTVAELWRRAADPAVAAGYNQRVDAIHGRLSELWHTLVGPSDHRDVVQWMVNASAQAARLKDRGEQS